MKRQDRLVVVRATESHDGEYRVGRWYVCVRAVIEAWDRPEESVLYWPIREVSGPRLEMFKGSRGPMFLDYRGHYGNGGHYIYRSTVGVRTEFIMVNGGRTKPCASIVRQVHRPKVRGGIQTRFHQGSWQKLLARGWVNA